MSTELDQTERARLTNRAGLLTIGVNVTLTVVRALAAFTAGSTAVLADAANSGTDILATLVVLGGTRIAAKPPDPGHPYGHGKAEPVAAKLVGVLVSLTGVVTAVGAINALRGGGSEPVGVLAAWVTLASIAVKEVLARYLVGVARRTENSALMADAANQRTDVLASAAALVGALGGRFGIPALDPAMGVLVAGLILRMGLGLYWRSVNDLMDPAPEPAVMEKIEAAAAGVDGVRRIDELKARAFGAGVYVDCKVAVDGRLTVEEGHRIAGQVRHAVRAAVSGVRDVLVHVNPYPGDLPLSGRQAGAAGGMLGVEGGRLRDRARTAVQPEGRGAADGHSGRQLTRLGEALRHSEPHPQAQRPPGLPPVRGGEADPPQGVAGPGNDH